MPEYLSPGVYVEETSFRSKSIEGVSTSTAGFVGPTLWGPVSGEPELITSLADFERIYGGLDDLEFDGEQPMPNYLAHGVRAFFEEGGQRLYVSRVFRAGDGIFNAPLDATGLPKYYARAISDDGKFVLMARFPGRAGNMLVTFTLRAGTNGLVSTPSPTPTNPNHRTFGLTQVPSFGLVHVREAERDKNNKIIGWRDYSSTAGSPPGGSVGSPPGAVNDGLFLAHWNTTDKPEPYWELLGDDGTPVSLQELPNDTQVRPLTLTVEVAYPTVSAQGLPAFKTPVLLGEFGFDPRGLNGFTNTFTLKPTTREQYLTIPFTVVPIHEDPNVDPLNPKDNSEKNLVPLTVAREWLGPTVIETLNALRDKPEIMRKSYLLEGGGDGVLPIGINYEGDEVEFQDFLNDHLQSPKNGLLAFESVENISIVAAPGYSAIPNGDDMFSVQSALINHCEKMRYRIAVLDTPPDQLVSGALDHRNLRSSKYAALYYPWIVVANPLRDERLKLPPSGFVAGIYARNDIEHAVFKAPANEVVRLAIDFEQRLNKGQQDVLNPAGVNCFRFFPGRGFLLWGARTISDDPEWKYVSLRRYFAYLEHSIDRGTQWVVFENNSRQLWDNVRHTIEDFLLNEWKMGGLIGDKPEQAYFVRCDMTTMTQNDLDNGRLVCLVGVAPVRPAEFVIFRIGQWTATSKVS